MFGDNFDYNKPSQAQPYTKHCSDLENGVPGEEPFHEGDNLHSQQLQDSVSIYQGSHSHHLNSESSLRPVPGN